MEALQIGLEKVLSNKRVNRPANHTDGDQAYDDYPDDAGYLFGV